MYLYKSRRSLRILWIVRRGSSFFFGYLAHKEIEISFLFFIIPNYFLSTRNHRYSFTDYNSRYKKNVILFSPPPLRTRNHHNLLKMLIFIPNVRCATVLACGRQVAQFCCFLFFCIVISPPLKNLDQVKIRSTFFFHSSFVLSSPLLQRTFFFRCFFSPSQSSRSFLILGSPHIDRN